MHSTNILLARKSHKEILKSSTSKDVKDKLGLKGSYPSKKRLEAFARRAKPQLCVSDLIKSEKTQKKQDSKDLNVLRNELKSVKSKIKKQLLLTKKSRNHLNKDNIKSLGNIVCNTDVLELVLQQLLDKVDKKELIVNFNLKKAIDDVITYHNNLITYLGIEFATKKYKATQQYCIQLLEGNKSPVPVDRLSTGLKDKWPNALGSLRPLFHQVRDGGPYRQVGDQVIRTLFSMQRTVEDFSKIDIENIEYKAKINSGFLSSYEIFVRERYQKAGLLNENGKVSEYIVTPPLSFESFGPNKVPKNDSAAYEAHLLVNSKQLLPPFQKLCEVTGNQEYFDFMVHVGNQFRLDLPNDRVDDSKVSRKIPKSKGFENDFYHSPKVNVSDTGFLRKLTSVTDSGNKSRTVAIPDYWTQCLLTPFEDKVIKTIKLFYPTCSNIFDHNGGFEKLKKHIRAGTASIDATSWTDTFSVKFQTPHVKCIFGSEFATGWSQLVVNCNWSVKGTNKYLRYLTGQGMGTKGSFAIASLSYLTLVEFLLRRNYPDLIRMDANGNVINLEELMNQVGDDLWDQDPMGLIQNDLVNQAGMLVNQSKSKYATDDNLVGEFVSRNLNYGQDVSRISCSLCKNVKENIFYLTNLYVHINERVQSFDWKAFIQKLYSEKFNGKGLYPDHIWAGYYRSLIIDRIIRKDDSFSQLIIAIEATIPSVFNGSEHLTKLRARLKVGNEVVFRLCLTLIECEYMYSCINKVVSDYKEFLGRFPFGTFTKVVTNHSIFNINYIDNLTDFNDLSLLYIYSKIKESTMGDLFKLSLESDEPQSNLNQILEAAEKLQLKLGDLYDKCFYSKKERKFNLNVKVRIDRSYQIQKKIFSGNRTHDSLTELLLECLPNLGLLFEMEHKDFCEHIASLDNVSSASEQISYSDIIPVNSGEV